MSLEIEIEVPAIEVEIEADVEIEMEVEVEAPNVEFEVEVETVEVELGLACDIEAPIVEIELEAGGSGGAYAGGSKNGMCCVLTWSILLALVVFGAIMQVVLYGNTWWVWVIHGVLALVAGVFLVLSIMRCQKGGAGGNDGDVMVEVNVEAGGSYAGNVDYEVEIAAPVFEVEVAAPVFEVELEAGAELEVEVEVEAEVELEVEVEVGVSL
jgi:hypothetical protein